MKFLHDCSSTSFFRPVLVTAVCLATSFLHAATVWNGPTMTFTKAPNADPSLPANQDRMTANVWITRKSTEGLFNIKTETGYDRIGKTSPADTEWAYGELTNYASLTYGTWEQMFGGSVGGGPPSSVGKNCVVHLKTDDIYLSLRMDSWSAGSISGGGFSYTRSTPGGAVTPPPRPLLRKPELLPGGSLKLSFTNSPGFVFGVHATTDVSLPANNWPRLGTMTESPAGTYQFTDAGAATNAVQKYYRAQWP